MILGSQEHLYFSLFSNNSFVKEVSVHLNTFKGKLTISKNIELFHRKEAIKIDRNENF